MSRAGIIAVCTAVVLVVALICTAAVAYSKETTQRRHDCISGGGSWTSDGQCLRFVQVVDP